MSYIYWFYFIKQKHLFNMIKDILKPTSIWYLVRSSVVYIGLFALCPMLFQLIVKYFLYRFSHLDSLLINMIKLVVMVDVVILRLSSFGAIVIYSLIIPFSEMDAESRKTDLMK